MMTWERVELSLVLWDFSSSKLDTRSSNYSVLLLCLLQQGMNKVSQKEFLLASENKINEMLMIFS